MLVAVFPQALGHVVHIRCQLHAGRAAADNHDGQLGGRRFHGVHPVQLGHEAAMEHLGLFPRVELAAELAHAGDAKIVAVAAHADHELVIGQRAPRQHGQPGLVLYRGHADRFCIQVDVFDQAKHEHEAMLARQGPVGRLVVITVHGAGSHFVKQRLPDVRGALVDQHNLDVLFAPELARQPHDQFEAARTAADHDDAFFDFVFHDDLDPDRCKRAVEAPANFTGNLQRTWRTLAGNLRFPPPASAAGLERCGTLHA